MEKPSALMIFTKKCIYVDSLLVAWSETNEDIYVPVIPLAMRASVMFQAHVGNIGHLRGRRLFELIAARANWPNMKRDIKTFLRECATCTKFLAGHTIVITSYSIHYTKLYEKTRANTTTATSATSFAPSRS